MTTLARRIALATILAMGLITVPGIAQEQTSPPADTGAQSDELRGRVDGMNEQLQALQTDTDKLKKFKFSGYIQARWETSENKSDSVRVSGTPPTVTPANTERFYIRRGRLKLSYDSSPLSQAVIYFDGGTDRTIRLLEAYVTLLDPWTPLHQHGLTVGQMNVPFGYEIERSSSVRELPERSRAENVLFSGERDRGAKIVSQWTPQFETVVAIMNGGGVNQPDFPNTDPTRRKDVMGRARFSQGTVDLAVSGYDGRNLTPLTGPDVETKKTRFGADAQFFYGLPTVGGGSLKGEVYVGKEINPDSVRTMTTAASASPRLLVAGADPAHFATDYLGWYAMWVQNLGEKLQVAARYDVFDPNTDLDLDHFKRFGAGVNWFYDGFTRITVAYDLITTRPSPSGSARFNAISPAARGNDPADNLLTIQVQHKF
ncbi:MAG TPA: hypothetical protein VJY35_12315 [Candidatus Eisenbacteria bacterium]|nr:hypothetical protein [Candidatus Eisenbacteria bacterium]